MVKSFSDVIDRFGGPRKFGAAVGMAPNTAKQVRTRDSLNAQWFAATADAARERGIDEIDEAVLARLAARRAG